MRPTINEQLSGASRLLTLAENEADPSSITELVRNARRLVDRVAKSWEHAETFLHEDNAALAALLGMTDPTPDTRGLDPATAINESLRACLTDRIRHLGPGPERDAIGAYLRRRLAVNPT